MKEIQTKTKSILKLLGASLMCGALTFGALFSSSLNAEATQSETTSVTYYAVYDYVDHVNLMDSKITGAGNEFSNVDGLSYDVNFGYHGGSNNMDVTMNNILGGGYTFNNGYKDMVFAGWQGNGYIMDSNKQYVLSESGGLNVQEVQLSMYAVKKDGTYASYKVYKNGGYTNSGDSSINNGNYYSCYAYHNGTTERWQDGSHQCNDSDLIGTYTPTEANPVTVLTGEQMKNGASSFMGTNGILIVFEDEDNIASIHFNSFQITKYQSWDLVRWSTEADYVKQSDTEKLVKSVAITKSYTTVVDDFSPNSSAYWTDTAETSFNAAVGGLFNYPDTLVSSISFNDFGRDSGNTQNRVTGTSPQYMSTSGVGYSNFTENSAYGRVNLMNVTWENTGNDGGAYIWKASATYEENGQTYKKTAVLYSRYWDYTPNDKSDWTSNWGYWCSHNNAGSSAPCYKHSGYSDHGTVWDGSIYLFKVVNENDKVIANASYNYSTYSDLDGKVTIKNKVEANDDVVSLKNSSGETTGNGNDVAGDNIATTVSTSTEGIYRFYVTLKDALQNEVEVKSGLFYIDKTKPTISFDDSASNKWYTDGEEFPTVKVTVDDSLSGVNKIEVVRMWSKDGVDWKTDGEYSTVREAVNTDKAVVKNPETSVDVNVNLGVKNGYMYYKFKVIATDIAGNKNDAESAIYKYDASPNANYTLSIPRLRDNTSTCNNKEICLNWTNQDVVVNTTLADMESGVAKATLVTSTIAHENTFSPIKYDLDGGVMHGAIYFYSDKMEVTLPTPIKEGYTFLGWTGSNGSVPQKTVTIGVGNGGLRTYKANWQEGETEEEVIIPGNIRYNNGTKLISYDVSAEPTFGTWNNQTTSSVGLMVAADRIVEGTAYTQTFRVTQDDKMYIAVEDKNGSVSYTPYIVDHIDKVNPTVSYATVDEDTWHTDGKELKEIEVTLNDTLSGVYTAKIERLKCKAGTLEECKSDESQWIPMGTSYEDNMVTWESGSTYGTTYSSSLQEKDTVTAKVLIEAQDGYMYYKAKVTVKDYAGNETVSYSPIQKYDAIPTISYTHDPIEYDGGKINWTNQDVTVNITVSDSESGVQEVCLAKGGTTWDKCIETIGTWDGQLGENKNEITSFIEDERVINKDDLYLIVRDKNNNENSTPYHTVHIDKINPDSSFSPYNKDERNSTPVTVTVKVYDNPDDKDGSMSDIGSWKIEISNNDGAAWTDYGSYDGNLTKEQKVTFEETGHHKIKVTVTDKAGNTSESESGVYIVIGNPPTIIAKTYYWWVGDYGDSYKVPVYPDLKSMATALSELDGDISNKIIIERITYADGTIVDNPTTINTTKAQNFVAEFSVTDSNGNIAYTSQTYIILSNEAPEISDDGNIADYYVYQRYIDERKIALDNNSEWQTNSGYKTILDEAVNKALENQTAIREATVSRKD